MSIRLLLLLVMLVTKSKDVSPKKGAFCQLDIIS